MKLKADNLIPKRSYQRVCAECLIYKLKLKHLIGNK